MLWSRWLVNRRKTNLHQQEAISNDGVTSPPVRYPEETSSHDDITDVNERLFEDYFCKKLGEIGGKDVISRLIQKDKVFICHEDTEVTKRHVYDLAYYLKLFGYKNVIFDGDNGGSDTLSGPLEHLEASNKIIIFVTPTLNQKLVEDLDHEHVIRDEINIITRKLIDTEWKGQIIPILLQGTQTSLPNTDPLWFSLVYEDFTSVFESKLTAGDDSPDYYDQIFSLLERLLYSIPVAKPLVVSGRIAFRAEVKEISELVTRKNSFIWQRQVLGGDLPILSNFLYGREATLEESLRLLQENKRLVLSGMAGVGKTSIGIKVMEEMNFQTIWFIDTKDSEIELVDIYKRIVFNDLRIQMDEKETDIPGKLEAILRNKAKQSKTSLLIVFENVDHDELRNKIEEEFFFKEISDMVFVMILTRCDVTGTTKIPVVKIPLLDDDDAMRLLFHYSSYESYKEDLKDETLERCKEGLAKLRESDDYNILKNLALVLLEKHPLGITLAGSAKRELFSSWKDLETKWLDLILQTKKYSLSTSSKDNDSRSLVAPSIQFSIDHLNGEQRELLHNIAFWGSQGRHVPLAWVGGMEGPQLSTFTSLKRMNLVQELVLGAQSQVSCHSLVVECVWNSLIWNQRVTVGNNCLQFALQDDSYFLAIESSKQRVSCLSSFVVEETRYGDGLLIENLFSRLLRRYGDIAYKYGMYRAGIPIYQLALGIDKTVLGEENSEVARDLNNLSRLLKAQGKYQEAQISNDEALRIKIKTVGDDHPSTITSRGLKGELLIAQGQYDEALPLLKEVVEARKRVLGEDHPDTGNALNNLAELLSLKGDYLGAEVLVRQAMVIHEKTLGPDHVDFGTDLVTLGQQLRGQRKWNEAFSCYERALVVYKRVLGEDNTFVATTLSSIALLLMPQGKFEEAEPYFDQAIAIDIKTLGEDHPAVATALNNLAGLLKDKGEDEKARKLGKQSYAIACNTLGESHPKTIMFKYWETF